MTSMVPTTSQIIAMIASTRKSNYCEAHSLVQFFVVVCQTTTWNDQKLWLLLLFLYLQCIAAIACAEFPIGQWLEVIDDLYNMVIALRSTDALKEQALRTIGYICEDVVSVVLNTLFPNLKGWGNYPWTTSQN